MRQSLLLLSYSDLVYQKILIAYPAEYRNQFSEDMAQVFRDLCREIYEREGLAGFLGMWLSTLFDLVITAIAERLKETASMTKEKFYQLGGWFLILAGISFIIGIGLVDGAPDRIPLKPYEIVLYEYGAVIIMPLAFLLYGVGMFALRARYGEASGKFGSVSLLIAGIGGVTGTFAAIGMFGFESEPSWLILTVGMFVMFAGYFLFGIPAYRNKILPRWDWLPNLTGVWFVLLIPIQGFTGDAFETWLTPLMFLLISPRNVPARSIASSR